MKIAIFHNFLDNIGGAELVDLILADKLGADIYTTNINRGKLNKLGFKTDKIFSIGTVPLRAPWRQEAAYWRFRRLNLGARYDYYVIAGDWAVGALRNNHPNLWYVFSPMREIWDLADYTAKNIVPVYARGAFRLWSRWRRQSIRQDAVYADHVATISTVVQKRVKDYFNLDSAVVYPPVDRKKYRYLENGNFWLSVSRLIPYKQLEIQLDAFRKMPNERLIIVGSYESAPQFKKYRDKILSSLPPNVELRSWVSSRDLADLYAHCKGVISTSLFEDFGLTAIEGMAAGKPIIAPNQGGFRETVIDQKTGRLIDNINPVNLAETIAAVGLNAATYKTACLERAEKFDVEIFVNKMKKIINQGHGR